MMGGFDVWRFYNRKKLGQFVILYLQGEVENREMYKSLKFVCIDLNILERFKY